MLVDILLKFSRLLIGEATTGRETEFLATFDPDLLDRLLGFDGCLVTVLGAGGASLAVGSGAVLRRVLALVAAGGASSDGDRRGVLGVEFDTQELLDGFHAVGVVGATVNTELLESVLLLHVVGVGGRERRVIDNVAHGGVGDDAIVDQMIDVLALDLGVDFSLLVNGGFGASGETEGCDDCGDDLCAIEHWQCSFPC